MATTDRLFTSLASEVVPYSATYGFPSQSIRAYKQTAKIVPKNNVARFTNGNTIRIEFPATGYMNPIETQLCFNLNFTCTSSIGNITANITTAGTSEFTLENNISRLFRRCRILYGSMVVEDIQDYATLVAMLTAATTQTSVYETNHGRFQGIGCYAKRRNYHGVAAVATGTGNNGATIAAGTGNIVRRYTVPIYAGMFMQRKLIPLKWMSSQFAIELELVQDSKELIEMGVLYSPNTALNIRPTPFSNVVINVGQVELVTQVVEFDKGFDTQVFNVLQKGLPLQCQSWNSYITNLTALNQQIQIQDRSRSVRAALAVVTSDACKTYYADSKRFFASATLQQSGALQSYQWRVGGRYYPSQPVQCHGTSSGARNDINQGYHTPAVEAWAELQKVFDNLDMKAAVFGDSSYYISATPQFVLGSDGAEFVATDGTTINTVGTIPANCFVGNQFIGLNNLDTFSDGMPVVYVAGSEPVDTETITASNATLTPDPNAATRATKFIMAGDFVSDRGDTISGINIEEQSDLMLQLVFNGTIPPGSQYRQSSGAASATGTLSRICRIFVWYDYLLLLTANNTLTLIK